MAALQYSNSSDTYTPFLSYFITPKVSGWLGEWLDFKHRVSIVIAYDIICAFGIFTNGFPIFLTFFTNLHKNNVNLLVANMSSADMINCVVIFAQNIYILYRETLPEVGCTILGYFQFLMDIQVFIFPPFLSLNRYISLFHDHLYDRLFSRKKIYAIILVTWLVCALLPVTFVLGGQAKYDEDNEHCCVVTKGHFGWSVFYWIVILIPLIGVCNGTVIYCNVKIFKRLRDHSTMKTFGVNVVNQHREMLMFLVAEMLLPISAHTIYHVTKFAYFNRQIVFFRGFFAALVFFNSEMRGVMTMTLLGPYRRECRKVLCGLPFCRSLKCVKANLVSPTPAETTVGTGGRIGGSGQISTTLGTKNTNHGRVIIPSIAVDKAQSVLSSKS